MKIGLVIECFDPHRGGAEHWTCQFADWLLRQGHEVHVVARSFSPAGQRLPVIAHLVEKGQGRLAFAEAAERTLRTLRLDVIHDMGSGWYCDLFESHDGSRVAQFERKLPLLPTALRPLKRLLFHWSPRYRNFQRLNARQFVPADRLVLALSRTVAEDYQHYHGVHPEQIRLVYNGVDTERYSPAHRTAHAARIREQLDVGDAPLFLFVGHDFRRKGLATAILAMKNLAAEGIGARLAVVGGRRYARYAAWSRRLGLADTVLFCGAVEDPVPYFMAADAFVLPTFYDPCSLSVLEAAACGLPSITTACNGAGELLTDGVDGFVMPDPADDQRLADCLRLLLDPARRARMGQAAREMALRHTFDRNCEQILAIYQEIVARKRPGHSSAAP